jgi:hypothetical protein
MNKVKVLYKCFDCNDSDMSIGNGYNVKNGENVVAFYVDAWTKTGRAYPMSSSSSIYFHDTKETLNYPSIQYEDGETETGFAEMWFPEFEGWHVHAVSGGKTMSICLTR